MTFTVTPQPGNVPPRVHLDIGADVAGASFTDLVVYRDGKRIREQPISGTAAVTGYDYEAPFGVAVTYTARGSFLAAPVPDWTEVFTDLSNWSGSDFVAVGGKARSSVANAQIVRGVSGEIQRLSVVDPLLVRLELLSATDAIVASIQVGANVVVTGTSTAAVTGGGSFEATLAGGTLTVGGVDSSWSVSRPYVGVPRKVRVVSLGLGYGTSSFSTAGYAARGIAADAQGNTYVVTGDGTDLIRKYNPAGIEVASFPVVIPLSVEVDLAGNFYVARSNGRIYRYNSSGVETLSVVGDEIFAVGATGIIYTYGGAADKRVRRYSATGVEGDPIPVGETIRDIAVDAAGNVYVAANSGVRKFNAAGVETLSIPAFGPDAIGVDPAGSIYIKDSLTPDVIGRFDAAGIEGAGLPIPSGTFYGLAVAPGSGAVYTLAGSTMRKYANPSVGTISTTTVTTPVSFTATATTTLDVPDAWLIHPSQPALSIPIEHGGRGGRSLRYIEASSGEVKTSEPQSTIHRPVGRKRAVVITSGPRQADEWTLTIGAPTIAAKNAVRAIVDDQTPLLLRFPPSMLTDLPDDWYSVGSVSVTRVESPVITEETLITLPLTPVDEPIVRRGLVWTWGGVMLKYATWADLLADNDTWLDVLAGPSS